MQLEKDMQKTWDLRLYNVCVILYVTLSICHMSYVFSLYPVSVSLAKHCYKFHKTPTWFFSDARELILRHRKLWKPIRATRPTRLMTPAPQSLTVIPPIRRSKGIGNVATEGRNWGSSSWSNAEFGGAKICSVILEVQDMFRRLRRLKLVAHFQGKKVQRFYSMTQERQ